jgi:hypothetical protein
MVKDFRMIDYNNVNSIIDTMKEYIHSHYDSIEMIWYHVIDLDVEKFDIDDVDDDLTLAEDEIYNNIMDYSNKFENKNSKNMFTNILNLYSEACYHLSKKDILNKYYLKVAKLNTKGGNK